jgi:hypothetical protein
MDNLFEDSDDSEGTESKAGPDIDEIPEDNEILGEPQLADEEEEEEEGEEKDGGYSPVVLAPDVDWDIIYETRPGRMVLDIVSIGPEPRTFQHGETFRLSPVVPWENPTLMETYETFMEHVKATGLRILPVPVRMGHYCRIPFPSERIDTR